MYDVLQGITVLIILLGCSSPILIIGLVYYLKKRLEHKQIMAAIEKGTPLSELRPPKQKQNGALWIRSFTFGIALLIIGVGWAFGGPGGTDNTLLTIVLVGIGLAWLIRGLLYRKYKAQPQSQPSDENKAADAKSEVSA
jgi:uncharacterized membrane protein YciS (DUF1049 family)